MTDFERLLGALSDAGVEMVLVGGLAATVHGSARLTQDVDVVYSRSSANLDRIVRALSPLRPYLRGAPAGLPFEWSVATLRNGLNFTLTTEAGSIDLLGEIAGLGGYSVVQEKAIRVLLFDRPVLCLDLPSLIRAKRAAGRPKDLEALAELEALLRER